MYLKRGFTLIEMLITLGIMSIGIVALMSMTATQLKSLKAAGQVGEITALHFEMTSVLSDSKSCLESFRDLNAMNTPIGAIVALKKYYSPSSIMDAYAVEGQPNATSRSGVKIVSYALASTSNAGDPEGVYLNSTSTTGATYLNVVYHKADSTGNVVKSTRKIKLGVTVDPSGGAYRITGCQAFGMPLNNTVAGDLTVTGNIRVGENLQLNFDSNSDPNVCGGIGPTPSPTGGGKMRFDSTRKETQYCDGYKWYSLGVPETSPVMGTAPHPELSNCANPQGVGGPCNPTGANETDRNNTTQAFCLPGYGLTQITGYSGWSFDKLTLNCRHYSSGDFLTAGSVGPSSAADNFSGVNCPSGSFISKIAIRTGPSQQRPCGYTLTGLKYWCSRLDQPDVETGSWVRTASGMDYSDSYWQTFACPRGEVITEATIQKHRSNDYLSGSSRQNCDCRECIANLSFRCRFLDKGISTSEP